MKHLQKFNDWKQKPVNENFDPAMLQLGAVIAVLGYKAIKALLKGALVQIGKRVQPSAEDLKKYADLVIQNAQEMNVIKISLADLKRDLYSKIDSGEIKTVNDVVKYFDKA